MGRHGSCDCLCQECVPGIARPYLDIYKFPFYTYPEFHKTGDPWVPYTLSECIDDAIHDGTLTYIQTIYIDNAGSGSVLKRAVVKLYHTLTYAPSSTIAIERIRLYHTMREFSSVVINPRLYLYLYEYGHIYQYVLASVKLTPPGEAWLLQGTSRTGGFRINDPSRLYVHIRPSFHIASMNIHGHLLQNQDSADVRQRLPIEVLSYTGNWRTVKTGPAPSPPIHKVLSDIDDTTSLYVGPSAAVGSKLFARFGPIPGTSSRAARIAQIIMRGGGSIVSGRADFLASLYCDTDHIASRTIGMYASQGWTTADVILNETQHRAIHDWSDLRWRIEVLSNTLGSSNDRAEFDEVAFQKLVTPRWLITQLYVSRTCL